MARIAYACFKDKEEKEALSSPDHSFCAAELSRNPILKDFAVNDQKLVAQLDLSCSQ